MAEAFGENAPYDVYVSACIGSEKGLRAKV
jgi:hypothetical protein